MAGRAIAEGVTSEEYLAREATSPTRLEYLRGEIFDMAGGTPDHSGITAAFIAALGVQLAGRPCRVFSSDLKIRVEETDLSTCPDLAVVCGPLATASRDPNAVTNPVLLVEVLSPSTEAYDRGAKFGHYRHLASLKEMVFVDHASHTVEVHRRNEAGRFELYVFEAGDRVEPTSVGASIPVSALYADPLKAS